MQPETQAWASLVVVSWFVAMAVAATLGGVGAWFKRPRLAWSSLSAGVLLVVAAPPAGVARQVRTWRRALWERPSVVVPQRAAAPPVGEPSFATAPALPMELPSTNPADAKPAQRSVSPTHHPGGVGWEDNRPLAPPSQRALSPDDAPVPR